MWGAVQAMRAAGVRDSSIRLPAFNAMASAYGASGQWAKAEATVATMRAAGVKPTSHTYNALIISYGAGGQWRRAVRS
jgi:pentatricopeptide repeat protein